MKLLLLLMLLSTGVFATDIDSKLLEPVKFDNTFFVADGTSVSLQKPIDLEEPNKFSHVYFLYGKHVLDSPLNDGTLGIKIPTYLEAVYGTK